MPGKFNDTTVVIPTYNEAGSIGRLIELLRKHYSGINIIVCDDGSIDGTIRIAKKHAATVIDRRALRRRKGLTGSVIDGILAARTKYVVVMDGDLQHPPGALGEIIAGVKSGKFRIVVAVRKHIPEWEMHRRIISKALMRVCDFALIARRSARCGDIFSGYFGSDRRWLSSVIRSNRSRYVDEGYKVLYDTLKCIGRKEPIGEVGYTFAARRYGSSKAGPMHAAALLKSIFK